MTVAVVLNDEKHVLQVLPWAIRFAQAEDTEILAIVVKRSKGETKWSDVDWTDPSGPIETAIVDRIDELNLVRKSSTKNAESKNTESVEDNSPDATNSAESETSDEETFALSATLIQARSFQALDPVTALAEAIDGMPISLLIIPESIHASSDSSETDWHDKLYRRAPCRTMFLHDDRIRESRELKIATVVTGKEDDRAALRAAADLAESTDGQVTAIYFEPAFDHLAQQVGDRILERIVAANLSGRQRERTQSETILADSVVDGVRGIDPRRFDLILLGSRQRREIHKILDAVPGSDEGDSPAIAAVRSKVTLTSRLVSRVQNVVERFVPQLTREQRISLFERVQTSSQWDFDFVALVCLSTTIAALGLIDDSIPVVIGAMLVAPLMTPIVATGLGLAQGNSKLIRGSLRTVCRGFTTAFLIGVLVGFCVYSFMSTAEMTGEMENRNMPGFIDLLVALFSGIAAAYALGRPNLMSALPGVAIAAALVPPLATSGLSVALFNWNMVVGASLLFFTNMVAIVLGASFTFWLVGVRPDKRDQTNQNWPRWLMLALILLTILLTAVLELVQHPQWWGRLFGG